MTAWVWTIVLAYAGASLAAFGAFWRDKRLAEAGRRRVPERTLHLLSLCGGWPGSLAAIRVVRHKNRKLGFVAVTWAIACLHALAWAGVLTLRLRA